MFLLKVIPADHVPSFLISVLQVLLCIFCSLAVYLFLFCICIFKIFMRCRLLFRVSWCNTYSEKPNRKAILRANEFMSGELEVRLSYDERAPVPAVGGRGR